MGEQTKIEWTDHTFNPWRGCTEVSPGCDNCYARRLAMRNPRVLGSWGPEGKRVITSETGWKEPLRWDRAAEKAGVRRRVFVGSMMDVFEDRPDLVAPRQRLQNLIYECTQLDWLLLTKRPKEAYDLIGGSSGTGLKIFRYFFPNVWLGVSVENQETADERIPLLLKLPAAVRFVSCEPLLERVELPLDPSSPGDDHGIDWVIVGGESGPRVRPCSVDWIQAIVTQTHAAGIPCFVKQLGSELYDPLWYGEGTPEDSRMLLKHPKGGDPAEWPEDLRVRQFPRID